MSRSRDIVAPPTLPNSEEGDAQSGIDVQAAPSPQLSRHHDPLSHIGPRPEDRSCVSSKVTLRGWREHQLQPNRIYSVEDQHIEYNSIFTEGKNTQLVYQSVDSSAFVVHGGDFAHAAVHSIGDLDSDFGPPPPDLNLANQRALDLGDQFGQGLEPHLAQGEFLSDLGWPSFGGYAQDASTPTLNHGYSSNAAESQVHSFGQPGLPGPSPQHHFTFPISSTSDARTIDRTNTIPHSSTDLGNSGTPPVRFVVGQRDWVTQPAYSALPINPSVLPLSISAESTDKFNLDQAIDPSMLASTSTTPTSTGLAKYARKRGGRKPSNKTCSDCGQKFDRPSLLKNHMHVHTGVKSYTCAHCKTAVSNLSNLNRHYSTGKCQRGG